MAVNAMEPVQLRKALRGFHVKELRMILSGLRLDTKQFEDNTDLRKEIVKVIAFRKRDLTRLREYKRVQAMGKD